MTVPEAAGPPRAASSFRAALRADPALRKEALRRRSAREKARLALEIGFAYSQTRRLVRRVPLADALAELRAGAPDGPASAGTQPAAHLAGLRLGHTVRRTLRLIPGDTRCLTQALVLSRMLARRGIGSRLIIAVSPQTEFAAHAWLEHGGEPLLPPQLPSFERLVEL